MVDVNKAIYRVQVQGIKSKIEAFEAKNFGLNAKSKAELTNITLDGAVLLIYSKMILPTRLQMPAVFCTSPWHVKHYNNT